ncbi:hypothetical protein ACLOJK_014092 [Asimina triloba]
MEEDFDLENPVVVSDSDPIPSLFASKSDHMASHIKSGDAHLSFRQDAIASILKLAFDPFIAYLAVDYLDRFLSNCRLLGPTSVTASDNNDNSKLKLRRLAPGLVEGSHH